MQIRLRTVAPRAGEAVALPWAQGTPAPEAMAAAIAAAHFTGEAGTSLALFSPDAVILAGTGAAAAPLDFERAGGAAIAALGDASALVLDARGLQPAEAAAFAAGAMLRGAPPLAIRSVPAGKPAPRVELLTGDRPGTIPHWRAAEASARGTLFARDLVSEPANYLTPAIFATRLRSLEEHGITVKVIGPKRLRRRGFGALSAVGREAASGPRLVTLRWKGRLDARPIAFIGKGLCFDTGGISIKPAAGMEEMRADMAGAAACAGAMLALALRRSPAPAVAILAIAENSTGGDSYRPGDVLTTLSGRTVEVLDTDAEGRLVLADALHHARHHRPQAMIDLATLTGSIVTALGHHQAGLFSNDPPLAAALVAAGAAVGEPLWPMPIGVRHREDLNSDIADIKQCAPSGSGASGGRLMPDACHAAAFLREFVGGVAWAHLDIAGVEARAEADALGPKGASGFGVRLLDRLVAMRFEEER
ncbi:M17 family metallopeptidase [Plastoroseomonas arctica]|uniref:Leucyl aminopeptidase family protein n=1 Tax=Plastoroseomonas arctica TaxID=1509237 RepID=A0AAF1JZI2_9PROT|nr:leucyl aminopeptidase family protein [Plastoroseomonas arctica]MBR0656881.1 leucyl aminopeptidase family protein [Plastoroseomonas arctica]